MPQRTRFQRLFLIASAILHLAIPGESAIAQSTDDETEVIRLTVSPAAEPRPALKYHLLTPPVDQIVGNAATFYYKAMIFDGPDLFRGLNDEQADQWRTMPLEKFPVAEVEKAIGWLESGSTIESLRQAAKCNSCNWEDQIRQHGISTLLEPAQKMRLIGRNLALFTRLKVAKNKFDDASESLMLGYSLSRNMGHAPTLVQALIGMAIQQTMDEQCMALIAAEGSPNLYWALSELAIEPIDLRQPLSYEQRFWEFTIHALADLDRRIMTTEEAAALGKDIWSFMSMNQHGAAIPEAAGQVLWAVQSYDAAREYLQQLGYTKAKIEAMPVLQTVLLYRWKQYLELRDNYFKWLLLPQDESRASARKAESLVREAVKRGEAFPFSMLLPAVNSAQIAQTRSLRHSEVLRLIEALRMHAAVSGSWPERLEEIAVVPVPRDPATRQQFEYSRQANVAIVRLATFAYEPPRRFEITLRKPSASAKP